MTMLTARWTTPRALDAEQRASWLALVDSSLSPNPFYGPDFLIASETYLSGGMPLHCLVIEDEKALKGVFPLRRPVLTDGQLGCFWQLYTNPYLCLTDPLLEAQTAGSILSFALAFLNQQGGPRLLRGSQMSDPVAALFAAALPAAVTVQISRHQRAALDLRQDQLPRRSSSLEKKARKLARLGRCRIELIPGGNQAFRDRLEEFLDLEAKGWKGITETALRSRRITTCFAREAFSSKAMLECLMLDGRLIAGNLDLTAGGTAFTVKTAYDPDLAAYSPGLLLDTDVPHVMRETRIVTQLDSCAQPGHPLENHWQDRIGISDCVISLAGKPEAARRGAQWLAMIRGMKARLMGRN